MFEGITTIYFDLDNTLINRDAAFLACMEQFFDENLPNYLFSNEEFIIGKNDHSGYTPRTEFVEWFIQHYQPLGWDETSFWNYLQTNISNFIEPIPTALVDLLIDLQQRHYLGILTNGSISNQSRKIKQAQLQTIFQTETIHIAQQYHLSKPNRRLFELILKQRQLLPQQMLYVGDDPMNDIIGASRVGIKTCWVSHQREWTSAIQPDLIIENILQLSI